MPMPRNVSLVIMFLLVTALLAGCVGGDDAPGDTGDDPDDATHPNGGSVTGRVLTLDLVEIADARIVLSADGELVKEVRTADNGDFEIQGVEPGPYLLQANAPCCHQDVRGVQVKAGEATQADIQLEPLSDDDLKMPFTERFEWTGLISCGATLVVVTGEFCSDVDEEANVTRPFQIHQGIKTVAATLVWDATGGVLGEELRITLSQEPCDDGTVCSPSDHYGEAGGSSPVLLRVDEPNGQFSFEEIEDKASVQLRVLPEFGADVYYQQQFTVYYTLHYHEPAPEGWNPAPDQ